MKQLRIIDIKDKQSSQKFIMLVMIKKKFYDAEGRVMHYVGDNSGDLKVFIPEGTKYNIGDVIKIEAVSDGKFKINKSEKIENFRIEDFLPTVKRPIEDIMNDLKSISDEEFKDNEVKALNDYFFNDIEFLNKFKRAIAGLSQHHGYLGGLAEHTLNVTYLTKVFAYRYNCRHKEIAILAAKLHDIGKIYEYSYDGPFSMSMRGEMEGHIVIGINMIEDAFKDRPELYTEEFKHRIKGCVVQHHGKVEYGSPKAPNTEEAFIVHYADYVDATMNKVDQIKDITEPGTWSEYDRRIGTKLFV